MIEIKTTSEIFNEECGSAYTDMIEQPKKKWVSLDSLKEAIERCTISDSDISRPHLEGYIYAEQLIRELEREE